MYTNISLLYSGIMMTWECAVSAMILLISHIISCISDSTEEVISELVVSVVVDMLFLLVVSGFPIAAMVFHPSMPTPPNMRSGMSDLYTRGSLVTAPSLTDTERARVVLMFVLFPVEGIIDSLLVSVTMVTVIGVAMSGKTSGVQDRTVDGTSWFCCTFSGMMILTIESVTMSAAQLVPAYMSQFHHTERVCC